MATLQGRWIDAQEKLRPIRVRLAGVALIGFCSAAGLSVGAQPKPVEPPRAMMFAMMQQDEHPEFPLGDGRDVAIRVCGRCHSPNNIVTTPQNEEGWQALLEKMKGMGATASDEDFVAILKYVTANFPEPTAGPRVNVNKAAASELTAKFDFSDKDSASVVNYRAKNGDFKSIDDLKKVPGIDTAKIDKKQAIVDF